MAAPPQATDFWSRGAADNEMPTRGMKSSAGVYKERWGLEPQNNMCAPCDMLDTSLCGNKMCGASDTHHCTYPSEHACIAATKQHGLQAGPAPTSFKKVLASAYNQPSYAAAVQTLYSHF